MLARDVMTKVVRSCTLNDTLADALAIMRLKNCGFVPIVESLENQVLIGVVTDRDLALFLGWSDRHASNARLRECYTGDVKMASPETSVHEVEKLMKEYQIHRVPVVDAKGKIVGIISLKDLADEARIDKWTKDPEVKEREIAEVIEAISDRP